MRKRSERVWGRLAEFFFRLGSWAEGHECKYRDRRIQVNLRPGDAERLDRIAQEVMTDLKVDP